MRLRVLLAVVALVSLPALAQQTVTKAGTGAPYAQGVQGVVNGVPIPTTITNSISVAGAADTVGADATFSANAVCAVVPMAGQPGSGFFLAAGTLAATLTPSISEDATPSGASCSGGNYTPSKFVTDVNGNTATTLVLTNPNVFQHLGVATLAGTRCVKVCTTSYTSGSAVGHVTGTVALSPSPAPSADVTDRAGRLLGKVFGSEGVVIATANSGRPQVDVITGGGSNASVSTTGAAVPGSAAYGGFSDGTNLQGARVYDTDSGAGTQYTLGAILRKSASGGSVDFGTLADPIRTDPTGTTTQPISAASLPLPTGASTETTLALIKTDVDKIPASPSTDRTTAAAPFATRLADGASFYDATKTGQLPAALDGSGFLKTHEQGTAAISAASLPLPTGASTESTLALIKAKTDNLDVLLSTRTKPADTQAISAASLPLPTGAAADATLTGGTAKSIVRGGAKGSTTAADVTSTANGTDHNALDVQLWLSGSALDPRSIRALTSADTVTVVQGTGTNLHIVCDSGCSSSAGFADNAAFTVGTTAINPIGGLFDDTPPTAITTGKAAVARITNNRALHINLRNQAGTEIGTSGAPVRTDPTGTTTQPVSVVAGSAIIGKVGIDQTTPGTTNGVQVVAALPAGANVIGHVIADSGSTTAVTQATASNLNAQVQGAGASGATKAGNPVQSGAVFNTTQPTVTTGQTVENQATARGAQIVAPGVEGFAVTTTPPANASTNVAQFGSTNISTGTGAGGAGIPRVTVSNDSTVGLVAGNAIVGKVGIDQTTPGTTNLVSAGQNGAWSVGQSGSWTVDISDRAARLLGVVYGSQGQQLKQTATNFNLQSELAVGGTLIDPRSIRLLTSSDVVDVSDRTARVLGHVICDSGCTPGGSFSDSTAFTSGSTALNIAGGVYDDTLGAVPTGDAAAPRLTQFRGLHVNLRDSSGNEVTSLGSSGQITDGTYGATKAAVLPGYDTPGNSDPGVVVKISPTTPITVNNFQTGPVGKQTKYVAPFQFQLTDEGGHVADVQTAGKPANTNSKALVVSPLPVPSPICPYNASISQTSGTVVIPGNPSKLTYICKVLVVSATAQSLSLTEGTGATCGTLAAALAGSTTVANGMSLAANGGWVEGNGAAVVYTAKKIGDDICLLQSGAGTVAGSVSYTYF